MDLFDSGRYFSFHVPVKTYSNPLLKYAACAYAAKQLGRVRGQKPILGGVCSQQARMEIWPGIENVDWLLQAVKYYQKAISLLMDALEQEQHWPNESKSQASAMHIDSILRTCNEDQAPMQGRPRTSDELLAATAILCEVEAMDANGLAWDRHLKGMKSLLDVAEIGMQPECGTPDSQDEVKFAGARKAIFWNLARQDFAAACMCWPHVL